MRDSVSFVFVALVVGVFLIGFCGTLLLFGVPWPMALAPIWAPLAVGLLICAVAALVAGTLSFLDWISRGGWR